MNKLYFEINGSGAELYIGEISVDEKEKLELTAGKLSTPLEEIWYHRPDVLKEILGQDNWRDVDALGGFVGPIFKDPQTMQAALGDVRIYVNDKQVRHDPSAIKTELYRAKPVPQTGPGNVVLTHGYWDVGKHIYRIDTELDFAQTELKFSFYDCGDFMILTYVEYAGTGVAYTRQTLPKEPFEVCFF